MDRYWRRRGEAALDSPLKFPSDLLSEQLHPPLPLSLPHTLSYLTQLIETLNGEIRPECNPAFSMNSLLDVMWRCGVLFLLKGHFRSEGRRRRCGRWRSNDACVTPYNQVICAFKSTPSASVSQPTFKMHRLLC